MNGTELREHYQVDQTMASLRSKQSLLDYIWYFHPELSLDEKMELWEEMVKTK